MIWQLVLAAAWRSGGVGQSLALALGADIPGLKTFPSDVGCGVDVPSTTGALWCWLRHGDQGELVHQTLEVQRLVSDAFTLIDVIDAFQYGESLDLTGYEDGTENPTGDEALSAGFAKNPGGNLDGSSFVAVQKWQHDLELFSALPQSEQDDIFGRRKSNNEEFDDAPSSAHVKRTAQESFEPEAFVLRRSMPWADAAGQGLVFVAFGGSFNAFEAQLNRMLGHEDGIVDGLFRFTRPVSGSYYWCPPISDTGLNLAALGL